MCPAMVTWSPVTEGHRHAGGLSDEGVHAGLADRRAVEAHLVKAHKL